LSGNGDRENSRGHDRFKMNSSWSHSFSFVA
jgi:hypothetical protein